jgi:hypothetical protein
VGLGDAGRISGSSIVTGRIIPSDEGIDNAHARALEILGPGTVTRDQIKAIVLAAYPRRA